MTVGTGLPTSDLFLFPGAYERLEKIRDPIAAVRIVGSSANSCAYVACGRLTGYYEESGLIDWAVGVLLVEEAGGIVTDWWGRGPEYLREDRRGHRRQRRDPRLPHREAPRRPDQEPGLANPQHGRGPPRDRRQAASGAMPTLVVDLAQAFCGHLALVLKAAVFDSLAWSPFAKFAASPEEDRQMERAARRRDYSLTGRDSARASRNRARLPPNGITPMYRASR